MSLKTATMPNRQNVGWKDSKDFKDLVTSLREDNKLVAQGEIARRRMVVKTDAFVAKLPRDQKQAARVEACKQAGIVLRTFERWKAEFEEREEIGSSVFEKAEELGYKITASSIRDLADAKRLSPGKTPEEIVRKAMTVPKVDAPSVRVDADPKKTLADALNKYLEATENDVDALLAAIQNQGIPQSKLCAALRKVCGK
jgi:hypothetical protein